MPKLDVDQLSQAIQDDSPLKGQFVNDTNQPIKVFTDSPEAMTSLSDARFQIVSDPDQGQIFWLIGANRSVYKAKSVEKDGYLNEFPCDEALLLRDMFVPLLHSTYKCFKQKDAQGGEEQEMLISETFMVNTQLPAFIGRYYQRESQQMDNTWSILGGQLPPCVPVIPCITNNLDWAIRLTEAGPSASIIQKYQEKPLLTPAGHKMIFRFSVYLKSVVPLQAYVSKKIQVLYAPKPFSMSEHSFGDEGVHVCSQSAPPSLFNSLVDKESLHSKSVDAIRAILKAFQIQFGEDVKQVGEQKRRAIYSVDVQFDDKKENINVLGFSFEPAENIDYSEAFKALFFDEVAGLDSI